MLAPSELRPAFVEWNRQWGAPAGYRFALKLPWRVRMQSLMARYVAGMFAFQSNSTSREFEYPWAWDIGNVRPGMTCVDIGAGHSGFPFVLNARGARSIARVCAVSTTAPWRRTMMR